VRRAHLECGGLPPLCSSLPGFAKIKRDGKSKMPGGAAKDNPGDLQNLILPGRSPRRIRFLPPSD
jgi:hypothetical protein